MSHIFISYSKQDIAFARHLRHLLQDEGFAVWMDETRLAPSQKWWPTIEKNIDTCDAFIIIMSPESKESIWVEREILVAEKAKKPIFPILYAGESWSRLAELQYEDMRAGVGAQLSIRSMQELRDVVTISGSRKAPPQLPGDPIPDDPDLLMNATGDRYAGDSLPNDNKKSLLRRLNEPWAIIIATVITGVLGILAAQISSGGGTSPADLTATALAVLPTHTASPIATDLPRTPTALAQLDTTATEAMLQRTVDTRETENTLLLAQSTEIAAQTQTAAAPTLTATQALVQPTGTLSIPHIRETQVAEAMALTRTSIALTSISIQQSSLLATLTPTPNTASGNTISLTIYRDEDSFTLYVPQSSAQVSLVGLEFRVTMLDGTTIVRRLDRDYAAFLGMPFDNLGSLGQAVCFRLVRNGGTHSVPQDCQPPAALLLAQQIAVADMFWQNRSTGVDHTVLVYRDDQLMGACGPQASCLVNWRVPG